MANQIAVGTKLYIDEWKGYTEIASLSDWEMAEYRIATRNDIISTLAANVKTTGRKVTTKSGKFDNAIRAQITVVGDCEPDVTLHGWVCIK